MCRRDCGGGSDDLAHSKKRHLRVLHDLLHIERLAESHPPAARAAAPTTGADRAVVLAPPREHRSDHVLERFVHVHWPRQERRDAYARARTVAPSAAPCRGALAAARCVAPPPAAAVGAGRRVRGGGNDALAHDEHRLAKRHRARLEALAVLADAIAVADVCRARRRRAEREDVTQPRLVNARAVIRHDEQRRARVRRVARDLDGHAGRARVDRVVDELAERRARVGVAPRERVQRFRAHAHEREVLRCGGAGRCGGGGTGR